VEPGELVQPGRTVLEVLCDGPVELIIAPEEQNLALLREGQPAIAAADAFPERRFAATVRWIAPAVVCGAARPKCGSRCTIRRVTCAPG
jgi:HlyD family secretion protein